VLRLDRSAWRDLLLGQPFPKGIEIVEDYPAKFYAWRTLAFAMPVIERPLAAPNGLRHLRLGQVIRINIEGDWTGACE
jgi:hypothetical protein